MSTQTITEYAASLVTSASTAATSATAAAASARTAATSAIAAAVSAGAGATSAIAAAVSAGAAATSAIDAATSAHTAAAQGRGIPATFHVILSTAASEQVVARFVPTADGQITKLDAMVVRGATTTDKRALFGATISDVAVSGGAVSVTTSNLAKPALGDLLTGSTLSGLASYTAGQTVSLVTREAVDLAEGEVLLQLFTGEQ